MQFVYEGAAHLRAVADRLRRVATSAGAVQ